MKFHLIDSEVPLIEGRDYRALCGAQMTRTVFVHYFNTIMCTEFLAALSAINTCSKCYRCQIEKRYVYGAISRELLTEERQEEMEVAA